MAARACLAVNGPDAFRHVCRGTADAGDRCHPKQQPVRAAEYWELMMGKFGAFLLGAVIVAAAAGAYLYYVDQNTISIGTAGTPDVKLQTN